MFWFSDCNDPLLFLDGSITAISGQNNHWTPAIIWSFPQFRESQFRKSQVSLRWWSIELQALRTGIGSCVGSAQDRIDEPFFPFWCYFDTIKSWLHRQGTRLGSERCFHANVDGQCRRAGGPAAGAAAGPWNSAPSWLASRPVGRQKGKTNFEWYCFAQRRWVSGVGRLIAQALPLFAAPFLQN